MARRFACLVTALALLVPINIGAAQTPQLPKTVSLSVVEKDPMPHKLNYKGSAETWNVQSRALRISSKEDGSARIVLTGGTLTVSSLDQSKTKTDVFAQLELRFASNGNMIEFVVTR